MFRLGGLQYGPPQTFATVFTFACFLMFFIPVLSALHVGFDGNVDYWIGYHVIWLLLLPIPILFAVNFAMNMRNRRPKRSMILACLIVPSVVLFLIGGILSFQAGHINTKLTGRDCATWPRMRVLDLSWQAADKFLQACKKANPVLKDRMLVQDCPGYEDQMWNTDQKQYWAYLQFLEVNYGCVGFCGGGAGPLWTRTPEYPRPPDSCAAAVASVLRTKVQQVALQLIVFACIALFVSLAWMGTVGSRVLQNFTQPGQKSEKFMPAPSSAQLPNTAGSLNTPFA